ncbi:1-phosphofructokinase [Brachyspira sp.]|uniref:1-phosphofructokinase n=1 Tax=Brachyspira sp. TaxID=1977261 RepID=UPI00261B2AD0|nr:1-phosphofructokinase [Brachyspira sp.]
MVYTLTLNPAIDYYIDMNNFEEGELNKVNNAYTLAGGKGINVSKVLKKFHIESLALGFCGGFTGDYIKKHLKEYSIKENFIYLKDDTRINIKLKTSKTESEIAGKSPNISKENIDELLSFIKNNVKENDILVLSGSVPNSVESTIYRDIILTANKNIRVILDSRDKAFKIGLREGVFLTKPNKKELGEYFNIKIETEKDIIKYACELIKEGSENVIVSLGKEGSILVTKDEIYKGNAPEGKLISSVGAGDSMIAGMVYGISKNLSITESYKYAIASGSSTACSEGLTDFENMNKFLLKTEITKIN